MKTKCLILFLALVGGIIATLASADVPPKTPADLKQEASHVVVGTAQRVFVHREVVKKFGGSATWTTYLTQLKVESVEKGAGIAAGDIVYVKTWRNKWSGPGLPPPGNSGHWHIPEAGERLSVFFENLNGLNHAVLQSGMSAAPKKKEKEGVIELRNAEGEPGLKRLNQATHIFSYSNDQTWLQFSFDRVPFADEDVLKACRDSFKYCNVEVRFPERTTETSRVYTQLRGPLRTLGKAQSFQNMKDVKLTFTRFEDRRLRGTLSGTITRLTTRTKGPGLRTGDIAGVGHVDKDANIPFEVDFDLSID